MKLHTKEDTNIFYEKGEEVFLMPEESGLAFIFDITEDITADEEKIKRVTEALDNIGKFERIAKDYIKKELENQGNKNYETIGYFMKFHRDDLEPELVRELFQSANPSDLTFNQMVDFLKLKCFGSYVDENTNEQYFIIDFSFNPEITDELLVAYFDSDRKIFDITHES